MVITQVFYLNNWWMCITHSVLQVLRVEKPGGLFPELNMGHVPQLLDLSILLASKIPKVIRLHLMHICPCIPNDLCMAFCRGLLTCVACLTW